MQTITEKLARVHVIDGYTKADYRHLIHGCGGSPRRANKAAKHGLADMLRDCYVMALAEGDAHATATRKCNDLWLSLVPKADDAEGAEAQAALDADRVADLTAKAGAYAATKANPLPADALAAAVAWCVEVEFPDLWEALIDAYDTHQAVRDYLPRRSVRDVCKALDCYAGDDAAMVAEFTGWLAANPA